MKNNKYTRVKILEDGTPVRIESLFKKNKKYISKINGKYIYPKDYYKQFYIPVKEGPNFASGKNKKYISKINGKYIYPKNYYKQYYTPVKEGSFFSSGKKKKMYIKNGKYTYINKCKPSDFFGPFLPPLLLPAPVKPFLLPQPVIHGQRGIISNGYYYRNMETVLQKQKDKRKSLNEKRPSLNLICNYCNKPFILPGMKKNGHKQQPIKYCSGTCEDRQSRLKKLWIPKWLFNFYLNKKLFRIVIGFKNSKYSMFSWNRRWRILGNHNYTFKIFFAGVYWKRHGWFWNPKCFWRKKFKWLDNYKIKKSKENRINYVKIYSKSKKHKQWVIDWQKRQPKNSNFKIANALRASIVGALKRQGIRKSRRTEELLGTSKINARKHIESLFLPRMTWKNHGLGKDKWHIDHKIPCASFDLKCPVQQLACCYYKNLQPLWAIDNIKKGAKLNYNEFR
jgi:hypothetical protein